MANTKTPAKDSFRIKLMRKLTLAPEARNEPAKEPYPAGRVKKFIDILRANYSHLTLVNVLTLIFAIPLIVAVGYIMTQGFERFTYILLNIEKPYLLTNFGFGLSEGASLSAFKLSMLMSYRVFITAIAVCLPFLGVGLAGANYVITKLVWGESFICKKDKLGNKVPRIVLEFFRGIKLYWKQSLLFVSVYALIIAACGNMIISFVAGIWSGNAGAGEYIMLIAAIIVFLFSSLVMVNLLPTVVSYGTKIRDKVKNSVILTLVFFIPSLFIFIFGTILLYLIPVSGIFAFIAVVGFIMIGISFTMLLIINYADYNAEKVLTPLYEMSVSDGKKVKKPEAKKDAGKSEGKKNANKPANAQKKGKK